MEYIHHASDRKYQGWRGNVLCLTGFVLYFFLITLLNRFSSFEGLAGVLYGCLLFLYSMVALKGDGADFVMFSFLWVMIALISACIMFGILGIVTGEGIGMLLQTARYYLSLQLLGGMFGMAVILSVLYRMLYRYRKERLEQEYLVEGQKLQAEQLHDLYQSGREANHMKHDMKIKLETIYGLLEKEEYEEAKLCLRRLGAEWGNSLELPGDTGNEGLNAALMKATQRCREKEVRFLLLLSAGISPRT